MTTDEIKQLIAAKIAGQGSAIDSASVLPAILNGICDIIKNDISAIIDRLTLPDVTPYNHRTIPEGILESIREKGGFIYENETFYPYYLESLIEETASQGQFDSCETFVNYISYAPDKSILEYTAATIVDGVLNIYKI